MKAFLKDLAKLAAYAIIAAIFISLAVLSVATIDGEPGTVFIIKLLGVSFPPFMLSR